MTSTESVQLVKRVNESAKKSPLKVVSPIIRKYSGHRQGKIKKLKFPRLLHGGRTRQKKQIKPQLKSILPKTNAGDVILVEPELLPCAINPQKKKRKEDDVENVTDGCNEQPVDLDGKVSENSPVKDSCNKINKHKLLPNNNKKKIKCLKTLEASLELLDSDTTAMKEKREQAFAENYLLRVQQTLRGKNENLYNQFVDLICDFQTNGLSVCDMYKKVKIIFHSHSDLCEDFVAFLTPEQAVECGVFMEHLLLTTMTDFLNMVNIYFAKSPQQIKKIYSVLESLATKPNVTTEQVVSSVLPLLKGNPALRDYFLQLLPNSRPPENFLTDFEEIDFSELNSDGSDDEEVMETVHLPEVEDSFGGELCPCKCHNGDEEKYKNQADHCVSCSTKFINGKIFIQQGKLLRPARVVFDNHDMNFHRDRLAPKLLSKKGRKRHRHALFKDNLSPTKSCNLSSDEFKSDIEDEEKGRLKLFSSKSPKISRKKSVSPKHCDKILSKCLYNDNKCESDLEEKPSYGKSFDLLLVNEEEEQVFSDTPMEVDNPQESEMPCLSTLLSDEENSAKEEVDLSKGSFNLPTINNCEIGKVGDSEEHKVESCEKAKNVPPVFLEKDGSHSPPVISIPETAIPMFTEAKPILSILENLDSKETPVVLDISEVKKEENNRVKVDDVKEEESSQPWKIEEDRVILQTLQVEENCEETFVKIGKSIPNRSVADIKKRFAELMNILYEMKSKTQNR